MADIQGLFSSANILSSRRKYSTSDILWLAYPEYATVAFFARNLKSKPVSDSKFRWFEQSLPQSYVQVNNVTGYTATDTNIVVDDAKPVRAGTVLKNITTGEQIRVTASDTSTNTLTVQRGWGTTAAAAIADNEVLVIVGDAFLDVSLPTAITTEPVEKYNYTQTFREPITMTETAAATDTYPEGNDFKTKREVALRVHKEKIEKAFIWGEPKEDLTGQVPVTATGGLNYFITSNVVNAGGALTETEFQDFVRLGFKRGEKKLGVLSPLVSSALSYWAGNKLVMYPSEKTYGVAVSEYVSPHGQLKFVTEKLFQDYSVWNGYSFIIDLEKIGYRYLANNGINRDTRLRPNRQAPGDDIMAEEYLTECGLFLADEGSFAKLYGVTSYN